MRGGAAVKNCCSCENMNFFGDRIKELNGFREILSKTVNVWAVFAGKNNISLNLIICIFAKIIKAFSFQPYHHVFFLRNSSLWVVSRGFACIIK
jgi:hypothetical protein